MKEPDPKLFRDTLIIGLVFWLPLLIVFGLIAYGLFFSPDYRRI